MKLFLYILAALILFIAVGAMIRHLRLRKLMRGRRDMNLDRASFIAAFQNLGVPDHIPAAVHDYYSSQQASKDFRFLPDDKYSEVLWDDPDDIEDDLRTLVDRLGMRFLPEYIVRQRGEKPIQTLRDMVMWLDWIHKHQPTT